MTALTTERVGGALVLELSRPDRLNALDTPLVEAIHDALDHAQREQPDVLVLLGRGSSFCAGFDLRQELEADAEIAQLGRMQDLTTRLRSIPIPSVCGVHGNVVGGGLELALACDLVISTPDARLCFPDVRAAFAVGGGATYLLPRLIGVARARLLLLTGRPLTGVDAFSMGLVAAVADSGDLRRTVLDLAAELTSFSADALQRIRSGIDAGLAGALDGALRRELDDMTATLHSAAGASSVQSFRVHGSYAQA